MGTGNPNPRHIAREQESLDRQEIVMRIHLLNKPYRIVNEKLSFKQTHMRSGEGDPRIE